MQKTNFVISDVNRRGGPFWLLEDQFLGFARDTVTKDFARTIKQISLKSVSINMGGKPNKGLRDPMIIVPCLLSVATLIFPQWVLFAN